MPEIPRDTASAPGCLASNMKPEVRESPRSMWILMGFIKCNRGIMMGYSLKRLNGPRNKPMDSAWYTAWGIVVCSHDAESVTYTMFFQLFYWCTRQACFLAPASRQ